MTRLPAAAVTRPARPDHPGEAWSFERLRLDGPVGELGGLARLARIWQCKRASAALPGWEDFESGDFSSWHGWLAVLELGEAGRPTQVRVFGARFADYLKRDATGTSVGGALFGGEAEPALDGLAEIAAEGGIALCEGRFDWDGRCYRRFRGCGLPLSSDGKRVDRVLVGLIDVPPPGAGFEILGVPDHVAA